MKFKSIKEEEKRLYPTDRENSKVTKISKGILSGVLANLAIKSSVFAYESAEIQINGGLSEIKDPPIRSVTFEVFQIGSVLAVIVSLIASLAFIISLIVYAVKNKEKQQNKKALRNALIVGLIISIVILIISIGGVILSIL